MAKKSQYYTKNMEGNYTKNMEENMKMRKEEYYIGLDIGTNSVGYAVTDGNYRILSYKNKSMWGVRLFDEAITAADRRVSRGTRRRFGRRRWRIELLQEIFAEEIFKVDPGFFQRIKESRLWIEDKTVKQRFSLFNDNEYNDIDFYKKYATIYHLRKALLTEDKKFDIRLIYIALHHLIKHRGHFLFNGTIEKVTSFSTVYDLFVDTLRDELNINIECQSTTEFENILKNRMLSKKDKNNKIMQILSCPKSDKALKSVIGLICGMKIKLADLFNDDTLKEIEKSSLSFADDDLSELREMFEIDLQERCRVIDVLKTVYDWVVMADILSDGEYQGSSYLSVAKVKVYEKHKQDLQLLKKVILQAGREVCNDFFQKDGNANYCAYIGYTIRDGKKKKVKSKCSYEEFKKEIISIITKKIEESSDTKKILEELEVGSFLPKQVSKDNGVIPYQINKIEICKILNNISKYYEFILAKDSEGITAFDKIIKIFEFRVPYFVGPLNNYQNQNAWAVRKEDGKITPWNIESKIDYQETARCFIRRMTNKCTYLIGKDVIPQNSLLYSEFMVWNEINNIKIGGEKIPVALKAKLFETLYKRKKKVKLKDIREFFVSEGYDLNNQSFSGVDNQLKSSLKSYHDFRKIFGDRINTYKVQVMAEKIINWITIYNGDEKMIKNMIRREYNEELISDQELSKITKLNYQGWGRFSKEFLNGILGENKDNGENGSIIFMLRNTQDNLMQLLSSKYTFIDKVEQENSMNEIDKQTFSYENLLGNVVASPAIKRAVWQTLLIVKEIIKVMGGEPKKIFVEMAREAGEKQRTVSRKAKLLDLYKSIKDEERDWVKEIDDRNEGEFRSIKLYLYYTQMGRCMYSGNPIDLAHLSDANIYDRDHIYPRSLTQDNSLDNLVLVERTLNAKKDNDIISPDIQKNMCKFWKYLKEKKLISEEKYNRLMRKTPLTEEELAGFINRQLVETRQSAKLVTQIMKSYFDQSSIVYVKAGIASQLRQDKLNEKKIRSLNDYHHAKDAYLNIVAGNVYYEKFTNNPLNWLKTSKNKEYSLNHMYDYDLTRKGQLIWKKGKTGSIRTVQEQMAKNDILYTRYATTNKHGQNGGFFNQLPVSAGDNPSVPLKKGLSMEKYGGYKSLTPAYFALIESEDKKGKKIRSIEMVPLYLSKQFESGKLSYEEYCKNNLGLNNPIVILPKIKKDTLLVVDKYPMHLRGLGGKQLLLQGAVQLRVSHECEIYLKKLEKWIQRNTEYKGKGFLEITEWDGLTKEKNIDIYNMLHDKLKNTIYQYRPNNPIKVLEESYNKFQELTCEEQCYILNEIMWFFRCKPNTVANLGLLGKGKNIGKIALNKIISKYDSAYIINQSVTGLYEKKIDLLKI